MVCRRLLPILLVAAVGGGSVPAVAVSASVRVPPAWKNCAAVNRVYPHGVGKVGAHDKTSGTPVTTFRRSNKLYALAMSFNRGLDRDGDGIACETA